MILSWQKKIPVKQVSEILFSKEKIMNSKLDPENLDNYDREEVENAFFNS